MRTNYILLLLVLLAAVCTSRRLERSHTANNCEAGIFKISVFSDEFKNVDKFVRQQVPALVNAKPLCAQRFALNGYAWSITYQLNNKRYWEIEADEFGGSVKVTKSISRPY
jgi:hypothetical protein